jgi:hypothetical protein
MAKHSLAGIDELRACVRWADNQPESTHDDKTPEQILTRYRVIVAIEDRKLPPGYTTGPTDDPDYEYILDADGAVMGEREILVGYGSSVHDSGCDGYCDQMADGRPACTVPIGDL